MIVSYYESKKGLKKELQDLIKDGYDIFYIGLDPFLSGWGYAQGKKHLQINALKSADAVIYENMQKELKRVQWYRKYELDTILKRAYRKTWTLRTDAWKY